MYTNNNRNYSCWHNRSAFIFFNEICCRLYLPATQQEDWQQFWIAIDFDNLYLKLLHWSASLILVSSSMRKFISIYINENLIFLFFFFFLALTIYFCYDCCECNRKNLPNVGGREGTFSTTIQFHVMIRLISLSIYICRHWNIKKIKKLFLIFPYLLCRNWSSFCQNHARPEWIRVW